VPKSVLRRDRVLALLPQPLSDHALEEILSISKAELASMDAESLTVSVTPDRLDLLSEGGLGLHLQGATGAEKGRVRERLIERSGPPPEVAVDPSVRALRPAIAAVVVSAAESAGLDDGLLAEAVRFQELLHATVGRGRRSASLGIYPFERLVPPFRYALEPLSGVRFVPLDGSEEIGADRFFREHPLAAKYGAFGRAGDACLTLRDAQGTILSLPPILNSRTGGEARVGDRHLLLESTGLGDRTVREMLGLLLVVFASRGWRVGPVGVRAGDRAVSDGRAVFDPRIFELPSELLRTLSGIAYASGEVERRLARSRLGVHPHPGGWRVEASPWRPDLLTSTDVAEDVLLAEAVDPREGIVPPSPVRGRRRREVVFRRQVATELLGLGFVAPYTSLLVSDGAVDRVRGAAPIHVANPPSNEFAYVRDRLLLSHLEVLAHNTRHGYPQAVGEVGPVIVRDPAAETGGDTRYHAGVVLARETAGFADAAAIVDYLLRSVDIVSVREPAELPGTIPGRAARVRVAGEPIAELGEVHPEILVGAGVPVPVAWAELDLTRLYPLLGRRDTD
jgi:phenylalanyl-tRNA synthetase beta chain